VEWPLVSKDSIEVGNLNSCVAVVTLWTKREQITAKLKREHYAAVGNLYTINGINSLLVNLLANPRIRFLVMVGSDLSGSGDVLKKLFESGVDESGRIVGTGFKLDVDPQLVRLLLNNVELVDARGREEEVGRLVEELNRACPPPWGEPIRIVLEQARPTPFNFDVIAPRFQGSLGRVWLKALDFVLTYGWIKETEYGDRAIEALNIVSILDRVEYEPYFPYTLGQISRYVDEFLSNAKVADVEYTYGSRLRDFEGMDQLDAVIGKLKRNLNTRRALAVLWNPRTDLLSDYPPCLVLIKWDYVRGKLHQTAVFRSHDLYGAYVLNVFALDRLHEEVCSSVGVGKGHQVVISLNAHIYERDLRRVHEILEERLWGCYEPYEVDSAGFFTINVGDRIVAYYRDLDGKPVAKFEGGSAVEVYRKISCRGFQIRLDHAMYLGKELARAELALRGLIEYVQD